MTVEELVLTEDMLCLECEENILEGSTLKGIYGAWFCSNCEEYETLGE